MEVKNYEGVEIDLCPKCEGVWLDQGEIRKIVETQQEDFSEPERIQAFQERGIDLSVGKSFFCPQCGRTLQKVNYMVNTGVIIDRCPADHGIWLDAGELARVQIVMEEYDHRLKGKPILSKVKNCPRCRVTLEEIDYEGVKIDLCRHCGGSWCDQDELYQIVKRREMKFSEKDFSEITAREDSAQTSVQPELVDCLKCVVCHTLMERVNYSYTSGIIIDRCRTGHGIWLDKDEIEKIQVFAERGEGRLDENIRKYAHQLTEARRITEVNRKKAIDAIKTSRFKPVNRLFQKLALKGSL
jgi:Zn-finger nucleic acid-binding protein